MSLEKTKNEWRARVRKLDEFKEIFQLWPSKDDAGSDWPYNSKGVRAIGGPLKSDDKVVEQSIRFSRDDKYKWADKKIRKWTDDHGFDLNTLVKVNVVKGQYPYYRKEIEEEIHVDGGDIQLVTKKEDWEPGQALIIQGIVNSKSIDAHDEIVSPKAVIDSKKFYMEFPTVRWMHQGDPIGKTLELWRENPSEAKDEVHAKMEIDPEEIKAIKKILRGTVKSFSIGFLMVKIEIFSKEEGKVVWIHTRIKLVEISVVDTPANRDCLIQDFEGQDDKLSKSLENLEQRTTHIPGDEEEVDLSLSLRHEEEEIAEVELEVEPDVPEKDWLAEFCSVKSSPLRSKHIRYRKRDTMGNEAPKPEGTEDGSSEPIEEEEPLSPQEAKQLILQSIEDSKALKAEVEALKKENEKMKLSEDERAQLEIVEATVQEAIAPLQVKIQELEVENATLKQDKAVRDQVDKNLDAIGLGSGRSTLPSDVEGEAPEDGNKSADELSCDILQSYGA